MIIDDDDNWMWFEMSFLTYCFKKETWNIVWIFINERNFNQ